MRPADGGDEVERDLSPYVGGDEVAPAEQAPRRAGSRSSAVAVPRPVLIAGIAAVVVSLAVGIAVWVSLLGDPPPAEAVAAPAPTVTVTAQESQEPLPATGPVPEPARLEIPSLGIDSSLIDLFVAEDGTMGVPKTAEQIGWWEDGPLPGEPGASLIAAHVSLGGEPGAFAELDALAVGAEVVVDRVDGSTATYPVTSVEQFPKDEFPEERVYSYDGPTRLHLVTCGGQIDPDTGHYDDNVVVFADLVSDTRAPTDA